MAIGDVGIGSGLGIGESYNVVTKTYSLDALISLPQNGYYAMDMMLSKLNDKTYDFDTVLLKPMSIGVPFTAHFLHTVANYHMTTRFILPPESRLPTDSIINTLYWSWATVLDQTYRNVLEAVRAVNLEKADSTDLDIIGGVYHLRRLVNEDDEEYRKRLVTQTSVLIGHGTKAACEAIINQAIGIEDGCSVVTSYPGAIRIEFNNDDSMRSAYLLRDTLEQIIPNMIAAGTEWQLYTPMKEYLMDIPIRGHATAPYTMTSHIQDTHTKTYTADIINILELINQYTMDILNQKQIDKNYTMRGYIRGRSIKQFTLDVLLNKPLNKTYTIDVLSNKRGILRTYMLDSVTTRRNINVGYDMDGIMKRSRRSRYSMEMMVI